MTRSFIVSAVVGVIALALVPPAHPSGPGDVPVFPSGGGSPCDGDWCPLCPAPVCASGSVLVTPEGNGPTLEALGLVITVTVLGCDGIPLSGYPADEIRLEAFSGSVDFCGNAVADHATDGQGQTTFSGALAGGGWSQGDLYVTVGSMRQVPALPLAVNSPDINGDLRVDLIDVSEFAADFLDEAYQFRSDFTHDGVENLADIGILAWHLGEGCLP